MYASKMLRVLIIFAIFATSLALMQTMPDYNYSPNYQKMTSQDQSYQNLQMVAMRNEVPSNYQLQSLRVIPKPELPDRIDDALPAPIPDPMKAEEYPLPKGNILDRLCGTGKHQGCSPFEINNLNTMINKVGREIHYLSDVSKQFLYDKVKGVGQVKRMRDGLKNAYKEIYNLQVALTGYQEQLAELKEFLQKNKERIVFVDHKQLNDICQMVRKLQSAAENIVEGTMKNAQSAL